MPQLSLYLTDENFELLQTRAAQAGLSMSKYANKLIEQDAVNAGWPADFWELYGSIDDDSFEAPGDPVPTDDDEFERLFA